MEGDHSKNIVAVSIFIFKKATSLAIVCGTELLIYIPQSTMSREMELCELHVQFIIKVVALAAIVTQLKMWSPSL